MTDAAASAIALRAPSVRVEPALNVPLVVKTKNADLTAVMAVAEIVSQASFARAVNASVFNNAMVNPVVMMVAEVLAASVSPMASAWTESACASLFAAIRNVVRTVVGVAVVSAVPIKAVTLTVNVRKYARQNVAPRNVVLTAVEVSAGSVTLEARARTANVSNLLVLPVQSNVQVVKNATRVLLCASTKQATVKPVRAMRIVSTTVASSLVQTVLVSVRVLLPDPVTAQKLRIVRQHAPSV